jgi:HD-like signal output (HDOD) protein
MAPDNMTLPEEYKDRLSAGKDWNQIVAWVGDLPPLPHVASQAIALVENPDTTASKLINLLGTDPALAARVLKIANSAMFSSQRQITTLNQAILLIGFKALRGIIVAASLRQLNRRFGKLEKMIWENSLATAMASHIIARQLRKPYADEAFLLGLLHDLGKLVLVRQIPEDYKKVVDKSHKEGRIFAEVEQEILGFAHPLIGALVARKWNFSPETCQVILNHHDKLSGRLDKDVEEKTSIVILANFIAHSLNYGHNEGYPDLSVQLKAASDAVGFNEEKVKEITEAAQASFSEQSSLFMS